MDDAALSVWLKLRERADFAARSITLTERIAAVLPTDQPVQVLDLATGEGSNLRFLVERLPAQQRWLLVDRSPLLLSDVHTRTREWAVAHGHDIQSHPTGFTIRSQGLDCRVETRAQNLGTLDDDALFAGRHLVTASALLDLVSESWLRTLATRCRIAGAAALLTITYNGHFSCVPAEPEDEFVRGLMNRHQRTDKGLGGPAEGPKAARTAERCFGDEGYRVESAASDWVLGPGDVDMQRTLIDGWAGAALLIHSHSGSAIASWRRRRLAHVEAGHSHIVVGHRDIAAWRP